MKLRLALAQVNPTVGDLAGNAALVKASAAAMWLLFSSVILMRFSSKAT